MATQQAAMPDSEDMSQPADFGGRGSWIANVVSVVALCFSCISFYVSTLQGPHLEVYVPPTIHYGRDAGGDTELFAIPVTIANSGARSTAVLSLELDITDLQTNTTKRYYSAFLGEHSREPATPNRQFAPLSIPGQAVFSETVRFYPVGNALPRLVTAAGEYAFRLHLSTAAPQQPSILDRLQGRTTLQPIAFQMTLPWISDQQLSQRRTIAMHAKDWKPAATPAR